MDVISVRPSQGCVSLAATSSSRPCGSGSGRSGRTCFSIRRRFSASKLSSSFLQRGAIAIDCGVEAKVGVKRDSTVVCNWTDFIGGDLLGFDLDKWYQDVEDYGSIAIYTPPEGGAEGRYATRLKRAGYHFMNISARGLGDPESYLTKIHGVRPAHLGKQVITCYYMPPEVDYRLAGLPKNCKGIVLWISEAKVLSKTELQYLALLPAIREKVKVVAECGSWRSFRWKPLVDVAGLPLTGTIKTGVESKQVVTFQDQEIMGQATVRL